MIHHLSLGFFLSFLLVTIPVTWSSNAFGTTSFRLGRYLGYLDTPSGKKVAVTLNLLKIQPNQTMAFPNLTAILRLNLGGLQSSEYVTQEYDSVRYDYTSGVLILEAAGNELIIKATVTGEDQAIIDGQVLSASSSLGNIHLVQLSDEPDAASGVINSNQYLPLISGQYRGSCGSNESILQIESAKGMEQSSLGTRGLAGYKIVGRLGMRGDLSGCSGSQFCAVKHYSGAVFDIFMNRLVLDSATTDECQVTESGLSCDMQLGARELHCDLTREKKQIPTPVYHSRGLFLKPTADQLAIIPQAEAPEFKELIDVLGGNFFGYVHNESTNQYQVMRLRIIASTSTDNQHNDNLPYITGAMTLHFGNQISKEMFAQQFESRSFYLLDGFKNEMPNADIFGFTLQSPNADTFLQVADWRRGYIKGILYSHAFGRVGTFEVLKSTQLPPLSKSVQFVPSILGHFSGPSGVSTDVDNTWEFDLTSAPQLFRQEVNTLALTGNMTYVGGIIPRRAIKSGTYDFYTGAVAWESADGRFISGFVNQAPSTATALNLIWPGTRIWGVLIDATHFPSPYLMQPAPLAFIGENH